MVITGTGFFVDEADDPQPIKTMDNASTTANNPFEKSFFFI
jgi:hypothetical protein